MIDYSLGEARIRGRPPPMAPPNLIWLVLPANLPVFSLILPVNLLIVWDWIACELITLFVIFFHASYSNMHVFFFSRVLGSRNYKIQVVARVGRKSAVVLSGLMEASYSHFFIGIDFEKFTRDLLESIPIKKRE